MKRQKILITGLSLTLVALCASLIRFDFEKNQEADAYDYSSLPTTIDLNPSTSSEIQNYYSSLNSLVTSERQGKNLLKNLKTILKNGQKYYKYDGGSLWAMYEITDRDWEKSPAEDISGYDSTTKIITGYSYGSSYSKPGTNPFIHALYDNDSFTANNNYYAWTLNGSEASHGGNKEFYIDQEHIWPKSQGFEATGSGGARGDPMHLWPGDSHVNSALHNNNLYGYVDKNQEYTDGVSKYANVANNLLGYSLTLGGTDKVFEPQDSNKGDIARAIFYLVARYNFLSGSDPDGIDSNNPNLELVQSAEVLAKYTSSETNTGKMGILTDLLAWHHADPVDDFEIKRNNILFKNYTNNRNPFIDYPEWADYIWGTATYEDRTYKSYNPTPTGYADTTTDVINGYKGGGGGSDPVAVTGISITPSTLTVEVGKTESITPVVEPWNATNQAIIWTTSNDSVATIHNGVVTGVGKGMALVTATTVEGDFTATCSVTVKENSGGIVNGQIEVNASGSFDGWECIGLGASPYADGSAKFDTAGDNVFNLSLFTGDASEYMKTLIVTINAKKVSPYSDDNIYKIEAINGTSDEINVISTYTLRGADLDKSLAEIECEFTGNLSNTTGIRISYGTKVSGNFGLQSISWEASYKKPEVGPEVFSSTTITFSEEGYVNGSVVDSASFYNDTTNEETIIGTFQKNSGTQQKYYTSDSSVHFYAKNSFTLVSSKNNLTRVEFTYASGSGSNNISVDVGTYSDGVWTGQTSSVTFTVDGTSGHKKVVSIAVSYYDAEAFSTEFLSTVTCNNGVTAPSKSAWSTMSGKYSNLFEADKYTIQNADPNEGGTVVEQMIARYDLIISRYGTSNYSNYINRVPNSEIANLSTDVNNSNLFTLVIVIASGVSLIFVSVILLKIKKKRTQ